MLPDLIIGGGTANFLQNQDVNSDVIFGRCQPSRANFMITVTKKLSGGGGEGWLGRILRITFAGVTPGVHLFLPLNVFLSTPNRVTSGRLRLLGVDNDGRPDRISNLSMSNVNEWAPVRIDKDQATAFNEVIQSHDAMAETARIGVVVGFISNTSQNLPGVGQTTVAVAISESSSPGGTFQHVIATGGGAVGADGMPSGTTTRAAVTSIVVHATSAEILMR